jgi:hypothetical protein
MKKKRTAVKKKRPGTSNKPAAAKACCAIVRMGNNDAMDLTNTYQNIVTVTITAPRRGSVVLTGSGTAKVTSQTGTPWAWVNISIGPVSNGANNMIETAVEHPGVPPGGVATTTPFSLTSVFPVGAGTHRFYMVGIKDPNPNNWTVNFAKLTALFVQS